MRCRLSLLMPLLLWVGDAQPLTVTDSSGTPLARVMVTRTSAQAPVADLSDDGYTPHGVTNVAPASVTRFTDADGTVVFDAVDFPVRFRARAQGFRDVLFEGTDQTVVLETMTQDQYLASLQSNVWLSQLSFGGDQQLKRIFQLNCAFCHQQASPVMRNERTVAQWLDVIGRMNSYGARLPDDDHETVARLLRQELQTLRDNPQTVPTPLPWQDHLSDTEITEWPIGDGYSQMHDFLLHPNGLVYVGDNLFDRIYELDPATGAYTVYKVPHEAGATPGGFLGNRFAAFPKIQNYMGVHSFAYSTTDGHIFVTPSMQQALLEFDPASKAFTIHKMPGGYYPHTIRVDAKDRVWFTLALSSQVAMFDRATGRFTLYDLPARGFREWLVLKALPLIFRIDHENRPGPDRQSTGLPMPYGIDITPDGVVWAARLYANDIARIDPDSGEVRMIDFPFEGPRRLRTDARGNLWIVAFQHSLLVKYDPAGGVFTPYDLPVVNELPYALNVDRERDVVWVNGNQSDTILRFDVATETWQVYPLPRQRYFTRDIEVSVADGAVYTTNSHFPTWQSEGGVPTLLRIAPRHP